MPPREFLARHLLLTLICLVSAVPLLCSKAVADDDRPRIVAFGDSLTAGLGVPAEDAYPAQLQRRLDEQGIRYRVINAGVSGETTGFGGSTLNRPRRTSSGSFSGAKKRL